MTQDALAASFSIRNEFSPAGRFSSIGQLASDIILILTSVAGVISVFFIIIAGIKIVTAGGDSKKLQAATSTLTYAIIGLAITILAFVILRVVQYFVGSNVAIT